jgi:hypothetical protein
MIRHIVLLKFRAETTEAQRGYVLEGLGELPSLIDSIAALTFGADAGLAPGNFDVGLVADFASVEDFRTYSSHSAHIAFVTDRVKPILESRVAMQFEIAP